MNKLLIAFLFTSIFTISCSQVRESAGVNRKDIDEFKVIENPPLIMPPNFNLLPPEQLSEKNIDNTESNLAKEIIFGLNDSKLKNNENLSTMENILIQSEAYLIDDNIRIQINENFASEKKLNLNKWENEVEILDSIAESERLRKQLLNDTNSEVKIPKVNIKIKKKKKKRFYLF